jgi:hypothetical protein
MSFEFLIPVVMASAAHMEMDTGASTTEAATLYCTNPMGCLSPIKQKPLSSTKLQPLQGKSSQSEAFIFALQRTAGYAQAVLKRTWIFIYKSIVYATLTRRYTPALSVRWSFSLHNMLGRPY